MAGEYKTQRSECEPRKHNQSMRRRLLAGVLGSTILASSGACSGLKSDIHSKCSVALEDNNTARIDIQGGLDLDQVDIYLKFKHDGDSEVYLRTSKHGTPSTDN